MTTKKQATYERTKAYMARNEGWVTPGMIERDFETESPRVVSPTNRDIAAALRQLIADGLCERIATGAPYGQPQFKYRQREVVHV